MALTFSRAMICARSQPAPPRHTSGAESIAHLGGNLPPLGKPGLRDAPSPIAHPPLSPLMRMSSLTTSAARNSFEFVVEGRITARHAFQLVKKSIDFGHWQVVREHDLPAHVLHVDLGTTFLVAKRHYRADVLLWHQDCRGDDGFADLLNTRQIGQFG